MESGLYVCIKPVPAIGECFCECEYIASHCGVIAYFPYEGPGDPGPDPDYWKALHMYTGTDSVLVRT